MLEAIGTFVAAAGTGAVGGLGWMLQSGKPLTGRNLGKRMAGGAIAGLFFAMILYKWLGDSIEGRYQVIGYCGLAALAGVTGKVAWNTLKAGAFKGRAAEETEAEKPGGN